MGCDGGTIPRRDELVKTKQKAEEKDKNADILAKWKYCALSCTLLQEPIVCCELGRLFNKEAIIEYLLNKDTTQNQICAHIRNLKDVVTLNLTLKNDYKEKGADNGGEYVDIQDSKYICPVVGLEMNGKYKFCFLRKCGCVLSERALKEVKSDVCHKCGANLDVDDVITINGTDEEVKVLRQKMEERRAFEKALKKAAKKRKNESSSTEVSSKEQKIDKDSQKEVSKPSTSTLKTSVKSILPDKARTDYSVAKDPTTSETYKSIFTSHKSAQNRPKGHWVTYNPLYF
ncbi:hypothetical protein B4U80_00976 [Leptotrombidium deliense]|uniref:Replication termination factor 2 n=1 Tax=Leptotrombidium deliense TaxID=299467 RepID=A0A443SUW3_9ACAR|nr:hypothetical protein B4U80_00976 [Leptotrombidium deliense]